jgi:hypothetical protein
VPTNPECPACGSHVTAVSDATELGTTVAQGFGLIGVVVGAVGGAIFAYALNNAQAFVAYSFLGGLLGLVVGAGLAFVLAKDAAKQKGGTFGFVCKTCGKRWSTSSAN